MYEWLHRGVELADSGRNVSLVLLVSSSRRIRTLDSIAVLPDLTYIYLRPDVYSYRVRHIYLGSDVHLYQTRHISTLGPIRIYTRLGVYLPRARIYANPDTCKSTSDPTYMYTRLDVCESISDPIYIYTRPDVYLHWTRHKRNQIRTRLDTDRTYYLHKSRAVLA